MQPGRALLGLPSPVGRRGPPRAIALAIALSLVAPSSAGGRPANDPPALPPSRTPVAAPLPPPPGTTTRESVRVGGGSPGGPSAQPAISEDGRFVAFASGAPDLVTGDTNGVVDVFLRDRDAGTTIRLPLPGGAPVPPGASAGDPSIAADGSLVAFVYRPPSSATSGLAVLPVVLAWSRSSGTTEIVSLASDGTAIRDSTEPSVSGDGRLVAFASRAGRGSSTGTQQVFVRDRQAGTTLLVSGNRVGRPGGGASSAPAISQDGRVVAFQSDAPDLVGEDVNRQVDVFVRDLDTSVTEAVSDVTNADGPSTLPAISGDGRFVAFESTSSAFVPGDPVGTLDVFRRDRRSGTTTLVSVSVDGGPVPGSSGQPSISRDGRFVAFASTGTGLTPAMTGIDRSAVPGAVPAALLRGPSEVYARDLVAGETIRISEALAGGPGGGQSLTPAIGGGGRYVAFASTSSLLVAGDGNDRADVFVRDLPAVPRIDPPELVFGSGQLGVATAPAAATLRNDGWAPLTGAGSAITGTAAIDFAVVFDGCIGRSLYRTEACTVSVVFTPTVTGERIAVLQMADDAAGSPRTVRLRGGGSLASLDLDPPLGRPGIVTIATGAGFPPGAEISLTWSRGATPRLAPIEADGSGSFRVQVLVFHNDLRGPRELVADPAGGPPFPQVRAAFDVVSALAQPPRFPVERGLGDPPPVVILRR